MYLGFPDIIPSVTIVTYVKNIFRPSTGVYSTTYCPARRINHAVTIVGYGVENGKDYWLIKNSWSKSWGDNGYIKFARNNNNMCNVATYAVYPVVAKN